MKVSKLPSGSLRAAPWTFLRPRRPGPRVLHKLAQVSGADKASAATVTQPTARAGKVSAVADIGKALKAGQITPGLHLIAWSSESCPARWASTALPQSRRISAQRSVRH